MDRNRSLLNAIVKAHTEFIDLPGPREAFEGFLEAMLNLTESEYGFIGEVLVSEENKPFLKTYALTNISWNEETRRLYEENVANGLEFRNLDTLFGQVLLSGDPMIANSPGTHPGRGGLPRGHPPLDAFLGLPIFFGQSFVGMAGLANKKDGYSTQDIEFLRPLLLTAGNFIRSLRLAAEKQALDTELQASEIQAKAVLESALDGVITIDERGVIQSVNPAAERIFDYHRDELVGRNVDELMPEPYRTQHQVALKRYLDTGEARVIGQGREAMALRKDGSRISVELAITDSSILGKRRFTGIVKDISERRRVEAQLDETLAQLALSNENLLAVLNELRLGVVMLDEAGRILLISRSCEPWLHADRRHLGGKSWRSALPFSVSDRHKLGELLALAPGDRKRLSLIVESEDGRTFWMEVEARDDPQNSDRRILIFYDMTEVHSLRARLNEAEADRMVGESAAMRDLFRHVGKISRGDWAVLIEGETGVGKELVARSIHATSQRRDEPFVPINCGGLTDSLLTSQLFGHRRGAFTGAHADQEGLFEAANGGTLFLDEISEMPIQLQASLLRVIQEQEVYRVGDSKPRRIDVRILSASNRDLEDEVQAKRFREDLFYRLCVARVRIPPLRDRLEDIPSLVSTFLTSAQISSSKPVQGVEPEVMELLRQHEWPGNVRELKNVVESALITATDAIIRTQDLPQEIQTAGRVTESNLSTRRGNESELEDALRLAGGNRSEAAKLLGISRATLYRRLAEAGIGEKFKK